MVLPGDLLHCLRHEPSDAEECDLGAVFTPEDQHLGLQVCVVSGWEVQVWLSVLAWWVHSLRIATRRRLGLPHVDDLFLRHLSYKNGLRPGPMTKGTPETGSDLQRVLLVRSWVGAVHS